MSQASRFLPLALSRTLPLDRKGFKHPQPLQAIHGWGAVWGEMVHRTRRILHIPSWSSVWKFTKLAAGQALYGHGVAMLRGRLKS
ncbi:hypothetical protein [Rhizobium rhizogenes]|uniref:hypothetical protein n=1 Tax=Rhizobium rhizogenes TaxID=359 RepID=UPI001F3F0190|nr:hypothetical protein [Rhizobium rhizogenes]